MKIVKQKKTRKLKKRIIKFVSLYVACFLILFSVYTVAKYLGITSAGGTKDIAKWEVLYDSSENESYKLNLVSGNETETQNFRIKVTSTSEVSATYSLIITNVPNGIEAKVDNKSYVSSNNTITIPDIGTINANDEIKTKYHTITFNVPLDSEVIGDNDIDIELKFVQND